MKPLALLALCAVFDSFKQEDAQIFQDGYYDGETVWEAHYEINSDNCPTNFYVFSKLAPMIVCTNGGWQITFQQ